MSKILIVEDEEYLSDMYRTKFVLEGFEVLVAANGEEGFLMAKKEKPDLIFLDLVMPIMNGFQALEAIRNDQETKNLLVVILSNLGQQEELKAGIEKGANAFLIKASLTPNDLVVKARELLSMEKKNVVDREVVYNDQGNTEVVKAEHNGMDILFIEDNKEIIQMYSLRFQSSGYGVKLAENGAWGVKMAQEKKFDVIVMDMMMPAMNGYEMLKAIKKDSKNIDTPIIVISNSAQDAEIEKSLELGANKYLLKSSITPSGLVEEIEKLVKTK